MAITTTLKTKYTLQRVFIVVICLVMGLWGVFDYAYKIPAKQRAYERGQVCLDVKQALGATPGTEEAQTALERAARILQGQMVALSERGIGAEHAATITPEKFAQPIGEMGDETWAGALSIFGVAIRESARRRAGSLMSDDVLVAYERARTGVDQTAEVSPPGKFDRAIQWAFILCLPFAPYYAWALMRQRRRVYTLDDDGTLHAPEGTWANAEIADIDMSRWMSRSIASVVHQDGRRIKLDDYVNNNMHLIVGAMASERYPDDWEPDARKRVADGGDGPADDESGSGSPDPDAEAEPAVETAERT